MPSSPYPENFKQNFVKVFSNFDFTVLRDPRLTGFTMRAPYSAIDLKRMKAEEDRKYVAFFNFYVNDENSKEVYRPLNIGVEVALKSEGAGGSETSYVIDDTYIHSKLLKPIGIKSSDDFFASTENGKTYELKNGSYKIIDLKKIYERAFALHKSHLTNPVGIYARAKVLVLRTVPIGLLELILNILGSILWVINGKFYKYDPVLEAFTDGIGTRASEDEPEQPDKQIDFFGYKVATWTLASYSLLVIITYVIFLLYDRAHILEKVDSFSILTIALAILTIVLYESLLPLALQKLSKIVGVRISVLKFKGVELSL